MKADHGREARGASIVQTASLRKVALSSVIMNSATDTLAQTRFDNAMALFDEFVRSNVKHADAATLRGLESRFALRLQIQPSYWSQIKGRSRQIGERLARQFEQLSRKPPGWLDTVHGQRKPVAAPADAVRAGSSPTAADVANAEDKPSVPKDDDERFIVGLVLTYYRRHPQRARARLLELLGEVLAPPHATTASRPAALPKPASAVANPPTDEAQALWAKAQASVAPLKRKR